MVPPGWQHPRNIDGHYIPLHDGDFAGAKKEWEDGLSLWIKGLRDNFDGGTEEHGERADIFGWVEWMGKSPRQEDYMPEWPRKERTMLMMYENTSEGTPISPAFKTPEELARWLADNRASAFADLTASYEDWLDTINRGWACSAVADSSGFRSGVEALHQGIK